MVGTETSTLLKNQNSKLYAEFMVFSFSPLKSKFRDRLIAVGICLDSTVNHSVIKLSCSFSCSNTLSFHSHFQHYLKFKLSFDL